MELTLQDSGKQFPGGTAALKNVNLSVSQGEFVSVIGPSGAGKTTLFRILNGMDALTYGALLFDGRCQDSMTKREQKQIRRLIGTIYQDFCLVENSTCLDNVLTACLPDMALFPAVFGLYGHERRKEALKLLDRVGLSEKAEEPVKSLSGGQKQRVAIARALMRHPEITAGRRTGRIPGPGHRSSDFRAFKRNPENGRCHHSDEQPQPGAFPGIL